MWRARVSMKKETPLNFLTDSHQGRSTLRLEDVLAY
ncbi:hypothetical protein A2U01_0027151, partial [Trifolium medium]|nr:hypothetical protein [Trifolium medium]